MFTWLERAPAADRSAAMAPLLGVVAGEFAPAIAQLWPAPHRPFLEAPADRRHLVCLVLDALEISKDAAIPEAASLAQALAGESAKQLIRRFLPVAAEGLPRALNRLGEIAWPSAEYRTLLRLLQDVETAKILRHAERIAPEVIAVLAELPLPLRHGRVPHLIPTPQVARLVAEAFDAVGRARPADTLAVAERWRRADTVSRLFEMAKEDITPRRFPASPFAEHPDLLHLGTEHALVETGRRFRNCIATYAMRAASGEVIVFEWAGPPAAVLAISRDPVWGWRLEEARIMNNEAVPHEARETLIAVMAQLGVAVVRGGYSLSSALDWASRDALNASTPWNADEVFGY